MPRPPIIDRMILDEIAIAEYHARDTLMELFVGRTTRWYMEKRLAMLRRNGLVKLRPLGDLREWGKRQIPKQAGNEDTILYCITGKALGHLSPDVRPLVRLKYPEDVKPSFLLHELLPSDFRAHLLKSPGYGERFAIDAWTGKNIVLYARAAWRKGDEDEKVASIRPDKFFRIVSDGGERNYFIEADQVTKDATSKNPEESTPEKKLLLYETLFERDSRDVRFRLASLDIDMFSVIFLKRPTETEHLARRRFESLRKIIDRHDLTEMRRQVLFADMSWYEFGEPVMVEDYDGNRFPLSDS